MVDGLKTVFDSYRAHSSAPRVATEVVVLNSLRQVHHDCSIKQINVANLDLVGYADAGFADAKLDTDSSSGHMISQRYMPPKRRLDASKGTFVDDIVFARWDYSFIVDQKSVSFTLYKTRWFEPNGSRIDFYYPVYASQTCSDHDIEQLLLDAGKWTASLHGEIYVFDKDRWSKNGELFKSIQAATWDDVIADPVTKENLKADTEEFFDNRAIYEEYNMPWKRGIILYGSPGNGKTISIKALMTSLARRSEPIPSLYVKSLQPQTSTEQSISQIFKRARAMAPCLLVFEDLDSLVTNSLRSYFLNEVDGLEGNDGILMIGSTNHLSQLDSAVTGRPSRFDRKYFFKKPEQQERIAYARYWGEKISRNKDIQWQDDLAGVVSGLTEGFSFAYLKELFLMTLFVEAKSRLDKARAPAESAGNSRDLLISSDIPPHLKDNTFLKVMLRQVETLREEMRLAEDTKEEAREQAPVESVASSAAEIATQRFAHRKGAKASQ